MKAIEIKPDIYWVGVIDWAVRDFHGYVTPNGTTYNNYLILDERVTLLDAVKYDFAEVTIGNIKSIIDPLKIENLVMNHIEPDHAGSIEKIMELTPDATICITEKGKRDSTDTLIHQGGNLIWLKQAISLILAKESPLYRDTDATLARFNDDIHKRG